jgi:hypothetical protein
MQRPRLGVPFEMRLPSGRDVTVVLREVTPRPADLAAALAAKAIDLPIDLEQAALADANTIEAVAAALGALDAPPVEITCRNCGAHVELDAAAALPIAPLLAPPGDPELDPPVDRPRWHRLERPITLGRHGEVESFLLGRRTFADRRRVEALLGDPLTVSAPLVRALGLEAFGGPIDGAAAPPVVRSAAAIARALERLSDEAFHEVWSSIEAAWDEQHWPPRLLSPVACPKCGARHDLEPIARPCGGAAPGRATNAAPFPALAEFKARAAAITREVLAELGLATSPDRAVPGLEVIVDDGVPPCDDGGEPLLGSYTPNPAADGDVLVGTSPFVIAIYYRTFRAMYEEEPYDIDAEIRETIEHELEHHAGFLAGDDPLDDAERAEIARERARIFGPQTKTAELAAGAGWLASDFGRFLRVTWPLWALVVLGLLALLASDR